MISDEERRLLNSSGYVRSAGSRPDVAKFFYASGSLAGMHYIGYLHISGVWVYLNDDDEDTWTEWPSLAALLSHLKLTGQIA